MSDQDRFDIEEFDVPAFTPKQIEAFSGVPLGELSEEGLSALIRDLLGTDRTSPLPVVWAMDEHAFHDLMDRAVVAQRVACLPTTALEEGTRINAEGEETLLFDSKPMMALLFSQNLTGDIETVVTVTPEVALMFAEQLTLVARPLLEEGSDE